MKEAGVKDTAAYRITRQITDHTWGSDEKLSDAEFVSIYKSFHRVGGSWERLMDGDMSCVQKLEESIDNFMNNRRLSKVAVRILNSHGGR
jgi:hypothetical protein